MIIVVGIVGILIGAISGKLRWMKDMFVMSGREEKRMNKELEKDIKAIVRVVYCNIGEKEIQQLIDLIKPFCMEERLKEVFKIIQEEKKAIDKRFEKYY